VLRGNGADGRERHRIWRLTRNLWGLNVGPSNWATGEGLEVKLPIEAFFAVLEADLTPSELGLAMNRSGQPVRLQGDGQPAV